ncbi:hypothetical protein ABTH30_20805, partial [Acinetobacter baumannii]
MVHPEIEVYTPSKSGGASFLEPVYPSTEKLKARGLNGRQIGKLTQVLIGLLKPTDIPENIPDKIRLQLKLIGRYEAYCAIHF